jgi:hypothetical protein
MRSEEEMIIAVLHEVLTALDCLTHREGEPYSDYVQRIRLNSTAVKVKLADFEDNMDVKRLPEITRRDLERINKYHGVWKEQVDLLRK